MAGSKKLKTILSQQIKQLLECSDSEEEINVNKCLKKPIKTEKPSKTIRRNKTTRVYKPLPNPITKTTYTKGPSTSSLNDHLPSCSKTAESNPQHVADEIVYNMEEDEVEVEVEQEEEEEEQTEQNEVVEDQENNEDMENECPNDEQLLGKYYNEKMLNIGRQVYCRKTTVEMALGSSHRATHVARKLLEGVFKLETLLESTLTGYPARAQGRERQNQPVKMLDLTARTAIIEFANKNAKQKGWPQQSIKDVERAISQRLGEIKRARKN